MTSPVDTSVKHYRSDMPEAPVVSAAVGTRIAQLEACLCTGYGTRAATSLVVASGVATLTFSGGASAAWQDAVILVEGVTGTMVDLNGEQRVLSADTTTVTYATALADGTAAGTVSFKIAPAGWEKAYSKTNVAVFRSLSAASSAMLLRVDDSAVQMSRVVGYEAMSDVDTGTNPFPTEAQQSGGGYWPRSDDTGSGAVMWFLASDGLFFLDSMAPGSWRGVGYSMGAPRGFGDPITHRTARDPYACCLAFSTQTDPLYLDQGLLTNGDTNTIAFARNYLGAVGAKLGFRRPYLGGTAAISGRDSQVGSFPDVVTGGVRLSKIYLAETTDVIRGDTPGLYYVPSSSTGGSFSLFDTIGFGPKKLIALMTGDYTSTLTSVSSAGVAFVDITGPWG